MSLVDADETVVPGKGLKETACNEEANMYTWSPSRWSPYTRHAFSKRVEDIMKESSVIIMLALLTRSLGGGEHVLTPVAELR